MNILFIIYTLLLIATITIIYISYNYTIRKKILKIREWLLIFCGAIGLSLVTSLIISGVNINDKLSNSPIIKSECISVIGDLPGDTTLTKKILYNYLLDMRAPFPEVMTCQALIESNNFTSPLYRRQSNMFGMKSTHSRPSVGNNNKIFQDYKGDWQKSAIDYVMWTLKNRVDLLSQNDYIDYLGERYAEDPKYTFKIKEMLNKINFKELKNKI